MGFPLITLGSKKNTWASLLSPLGSETFTDLSIRTFCLNVGSSLCVGENGRLAPARVAQAEQPWGSIRRDGLPARLGAQWEDGL